MLSMYMLLKYLCSLLKVADSSLATMAMAYLLAAMTYLLAAMMLEKSSTGKNSKSKGGQR